MKKRKEKKEVKFHQHRNQFGIFGMRHPENINHKNENTQKYHLWTIGFNTMSWIVQKHLGRTAVVRVHRRGPYIVL